MTYLGIRQLLVAIWPDAVKVRDSYRQHTFLAYSMREEYTTCCDSVISGNMVRCSEYKGHVWIASLASRMREQCTTGCDSVVAENVARWCQREEHEGMASLVLYMLYECTTILANCLY